MLQQLKYQTLLKDIYFIYFNEQQVLLLANNLKSCFETKYHFDKLYRIIFCVNYSKIAEDKY